MNTKIIDVLRQALAAFEAVITACKSEPAMQARKYIPLGVDVFNAKDNLRALITKLEAGAAAPATRTWAMPLWRQQELDRASSVSDSFKQPAAPAWESTTEGFRKYVTDETYQKFAPEVRKWYKPYRCSSCEVRSTAPAVPDGWQLVPKAATLDMWNAASQCVEIEDAEEDCNQMWAAMLAAAPQPAEKKGE